VNRSSSNRRPRRGSNRSYYPPNPRDMDPYCQRSNRLPSSEQKINFSTGTIAVLAGVLILGVGIGSAITSTSDGGQGYIASQHQLDMAVPDPEFCRQWGASAFVSSIKSPKLLSSSSPTGFSKDTGSFEIFNTFLTLSKGILSF